MKIFIVILSLLCLINFSSAQGVDTTLLRKDNIAINLKLVNELRFNKSQIAKIGSELYFVIISIKDSVITNIEILATRQSILANEVESRVTMILKGFRFKSTSEHNFLMPIVIINLNNFNGKYLFVNKNTSDFNNNKSFFLEGVIFSIGTGGNSR